ncbi:MAG: hypothetical protein AAFX99_27290, partial [Myxococcota bacterium]
HCDRAENASRDLKSVSISIVCEADVVRRIQDPVAQTAEDAATTTVPPQPPKTAAPVALQPPATEEWSMLSKRIDCLSYPVSAATIRDNEARWTLEVGGATALITLTSWPDVESLSQHQQRLSAEHTAQDIAYMTSNSSVIAVITQEPQGAQSMLAELLTCR